VAKAKRLVQRGTGEGKSGVHSLETI
jgi:hypothetical protein